MQVRKVLKEFGVTVVAGDRRAGERRQDALQILAILRLIFDPSDGETRAHK